MSLEQAFNEFSEDTLVDSESTQSSSDGDLADLPGLGDWLDEDLKPETEDKTEQGSTSQDAELLDQIEESSFDEMLESIDAQQRDSDVTESELQESGIDIASLLDDSEPESLSDNELGDDDFLDVAALLDESESAEPEQEQDLDIDVQLEPFVAEDDELQMIDVDADDGIGAKLDLAHAYIEIGELESAKELLDDIMRQGNSEQIESAKRLLDSLN